MIPSYSIWTKSHHRTPLGAGMQSSSPPASSKPRLTRMNAGTGPEEHNKANDFRVIGTRHRGRHHHDQGFAMEEVDLSAFVR